MSNTIISLRRLVGTAVVLSALAMPAAEAPAAAPPPVNDAFAAASTLAGDSGKVASRTVGASKEPAEPNHAGNPGGRSVWFAWTAPADGQYRFETIGDLDTLLACGDVRQALGLTEAVRFEHHVTEAYKSIVRQPYDRRADVVRAASSVPNISAKHEGGDAAVEARRDHPSDIFDYFQSLEEIERRGLMTVLQTNYLDKHAAVNRTAVALLAAGISVRPAALLHGSRERASSAA